MTSNSRAIRSEEEEKNSRPVLLRQKQWGVGVEIHGDDGIDEFNFRVERERESPRSGDQKSLQKFALAAIFRIPVSPFLSVPLSLPFFLFLSLPVESPGRPLRTDMQIDDRAGVNESFRRGGARGGSKGIVSVVWRLERQGCSPLAIVAARAGFGVDVRRQRLDRVAQRIPARAELVVI